MVVFVAIVANIHGLMAILRNELSSDRNWSTIANTTRKMDLYGKEHQERRSSNRLSGDAMKTKATL